MNTYLTLGRVSNLPTVWTNVLAAAAIAGAYAPFSTWVSILSAMSLFYVAGMYHNDVCDIHYDRQHQPNRPIAAGQISLERVETLAAVFTLLAMLLVYQARMTAPVAQGSASLGWLFSALLLVLCIVLYNRHHKDNPFSPLLMAACRISVLLCASYTLTAQMPPVLLLAMVAMFSWLIGLTYLAKHERLADVSLQNLYQQWPLLALGLSVAIALALSIRAPQTLIPAMALIAVIAVARNRLLSQAPGSKGPAVALMIAGICWVDGIFLAVYWGGTGIIVALLAFCLTLGLQRYIAGT